MASFDAGGLLASVIRVVLRALIFFIGVAAAVQQTTKQAAALAGAVAAGETSSVALACKCLLVHGGQSVVCAWVRKAVWDKVINHEFKIDK